MKFNNNTVHRRAQKDEILEVVKNIFEWNLSFWFEVTVYAICEVHSIKQMSSAAEDMS